MATIRNNADLWASIDGLMAVLSAAGEPRFAAALGRALGISSLPGEILGETRLELRRVRSSPLYSRLDVRARVDEALRYIDSILGL